jgi:predicted metallopeptidase
MDPLEYERDKHVKAEAKTTVVVFASLDSVSSSFIACVKDVASLASAPGVLDTGSAF